MNNLEKELVIQKKLLFPRSVGRNKKLKNIKLIKILIFLFLFLLSINSLIYGHKIQIGLGFIHSIKSFNNLKIGETYKPNNSINCDFYLENNLPIEISYEKLFKDKHGLKLTFSFEFSFIGDHSLNEYLIERINFPLTLFYVYNIKINKLINFSIRPGLFIELFNFYQYKYKNQIFKSTNSFNKYIKYGQITEFGINFNFKLIYLFFDTYYKINFYNNKDEYNKKYLALNINIGIKTGIGIKF